MITLSNPESKEAMLFMCNSTDIGNGDHLPDANGKITENRIRLENGSQLFVVDTGDVYIFDKELQVWNEL